MRNFIFLLAVFALVITACKKKKPELEPENPAGYDQQAMFQNYSANLIVPAYTSLQLKVDSLYSVIQTYTTTLTTTDLSAVRSAYMSAYKQYMYASTYEFGPAATILFRTGTNIFPTDTTQINANISAGSYDLAAASQADAI